MRVLLLSMALLAGCATSQQGKDANRAQLADIGSTGLALALSETAVEANPAGLYILPLKLGTGWVLDTTLPHNCFKRAAYATTVGIVGYGAAANNLAIAAGVSSAPIIGLVGAVGYGVWKYRKLHTGYDCIPEEFRAFADAYRAGNVEAILDAYHPEAMLILPHGAFYGQSIRGIYEDFFAAYRRRTFWLAYWDGHEGLAVIKDHNGYGWLMWEATFKDEKIHTLRMGNLLTRAEMGEHLSAARAALKTGGAQ